MATYAELQTALGKLSEVKTSAQLDKLVGFDLMKVAVRQYLHSRIYHVERNRETNRLAQLARDAGLDK